MIKDYQSQKELRDSYDVCIIGAGPAGITLALRLAGNGRRVLLLEGGGHEYSQNSQSLYQCPSTGLDVYAAATRLRYLGGTSNHWAGRCRPFEASDFSVGPPVHWPGWPIAFSEIERHLPQAMAIVDLPADTGFKTTNASLDGTDFEADRFLLSPPTRFAQKYAKELNETEGLDVFINCNCVDLEFDRDTGRIATIVVSDYELHRERVTARHFILATGAIENARQLLNSESLVAGGIVTQEGLVGKCFMEHLNVQLGTFILKEGQGTDAREYFTTDAFVKEYQAGKGNVSASLVSEVRAYGRMAAIKSFFENLICEVGGEQKIEFITKFDCPGDGVIGTLIEQFPNPDSRVSLLAERDALGMRKATVHWELSPADRHTVKCIGMEMAKCFAESGLGFVRLEECVYDESVPLKVNPHAHHMGTTRMATTPEFGVVDENCKVFGVENLYVAGSSVFATGGASNPTMPLLQLALRLADYLNHQLEPGVGRYS
ncbi:Oxygen-dependent choline dehydrogenase [Pseudomonas fluorescens]|uniref:Oxygen-dependent choline dehydrogenase n=1 Tax=Pseudomonas fluorescens TaxID=294 RepID=A0A5E6PQS0_PSEFL|nr:GMC family oxidoreductase [Pseudomonas fluorescens]VVM43395.1 Oxygen-dependent choline dehydrogenase [Pseudomonas fluorescens]